MPRTSSHQIDLRWPVPCAGNNVPGSFALTPPIHVVLPCDTAAKREGFVVRSAVRGEPRLAGHPEIAGLNSSLCPQTTVRSSTRICMAARPVLSSGIHHKFHRHGKCCSHSFGGDSHCLCRYTVHGASATGQKSMIKVDSVGIWSAASSSTPTNICSLLWMSCGYALHPNWLHCVSLAMELPRPLLMHTCAATGGPGSAS